MSCRHCCINSKKSLSKIFSFHKIIYKYFAGFLACIYDIIRCHYEGNARDICGFQPADAPPLASNPISVDCHASLHQRWADARSVRNDGKNIVITREWNDRSNLFYVDCFAPRCVPHSVCFSNGNARTRCAPHGDDNIFCDNKNFQFDKFQRLLSVIYKKLINYKGDFKMRNQTTKSHNAKSKILLITLCIFGLLFSWSCSCKNRVSDPTGGDNGDKGPDGETIIRTNGGAVSGTYTIAVASDGNSVKTAATVKFLNATGKLEAIADVDASANTTLTLDDFAYTGTTLTLKDATDTRAKITWDGVDTKKVKATFSLTPTATNVDLTATTQEVEIEIGKFKTLSGTDIGNILNTITKHIFVNGRAITFELSGKATVTENSITIKSQDELYNPNEDPPKATIEDFVENAINVLSDTYYNKNLFSKVELDGDMSSINPDTSDTTKIEFNVKPTIPNSPFFEATSGFQSYKIIGVYKYIAQGVEKKGQWVHRAAAR